MSVKTIPIRLDMRGNTQIENITKRVQEAVAMLIEDEPGIRADTKAIWDRLIPADAHWEHNTRNPGEDNAHSHLRGHLQGPSVTIPFTDGALLLGTWQQIVVVDFDTRPRKRDLVVQVVGE